MFDSRIIDHALCDVAGVANTSLTNALVTLTEVKEFLKITTATEDAFLTDAISVCSTAIEEYCDRFFAARLIGENVFDHCSGSLVLVHRPVITLMSIKTPTATIDPANYMLDKSAAIVRPLPRSTYANLPVYDLGGIYLGLFQEPLLTATYVAGYLPGTIPGVVKRACLEYVKTMRFTRLRDPNVAIENVPDVGSTTYLWGIRGNMETDLAAGVGNVPATVSDLLGTFRRRV
jgi:hypothetical protein